MEISLFDQLIAEQKSIAARSWVYVFGFLVLSVVPYVVLDLFWYEETTPFFAVSFLSILLNFGFLHFLLKDNFLYENGLQAGIFSFIGLSFLHTVPVILGWILLFLPGAYLALRWLPAFARLFASEDGVMASLGWSWEHTSGIVGALAGAFAGPVVLYAISICALVFQGFYLEVAPNADFETVFTSTTIISNVAMSAGLAWYTILGVAVYSLISGQSRRIERTFE
ncbi:MAG: hypothetical protein AAFR64_04335 [Pseudomonadota bacterium]